MRKPVHRYEDTAANWAADNPTLPAGWEGVESDTDKEKHGDGLTRWNSLSYTGGIQRATTTVQTNVGTKQALLAAVPTGKKRIMVQFIARNASASLATMGDDCRGGFNALADDLGVIWDALALAGLTTANRAISPIVSGFALAIGQTVGVAGDVFGIVFADTSITATLDIDTFYYDVDA